jgi:hypothetical protein
MKVSIVVPNHGRDLTALKKSIYNSTYKNIELIIIDRGLERSTQRNIGIMESTGDALLILDSDQSVSKWLIDECCDFIKSGYGSLYIPEVIITKGFFGYLRNWERQFYTSTPIDCVRFVRKDICPLFDEEMSGPEDSHFDRRVPGLRGTTKNVLYHDDGESFFSFLKKKAYYSKSMLLYSQKNPKDRVLNFWWRCFGVFFENGKWKKVFKRPDLFICVIGLIFIRGLIYVVFRRKS